MVETKAVMETIYKYPVDVRMQLDLPADAQPLTVQLQQGQPQLWVRLNPLAATIRRTFRVFGTGHPLEGAGHLTYIATFQLDNGGLVFHVFEDQAVP
jgi:hypothetical protein